MIITVTLLDNTCQNLTISQLRSLKPIGDDKTLITFYNGRKNAEAIADENIHELVANIRCLAGDTESYGRVLFKDYDKTYYFHHRISIIRESDNTAHKILCPLCANINQVYHTQRCRCKVHTPFCGKLVKKDGNIKLTKQPITIEKQDDERLDIKFDRFGENKSERTVSEIHWDCELNSLVGKIKLSNCELTVYTDQVLEKDSLEEKRYNWWRA